MYIIHILSCALVILVGFSNAQSCKTPDNKNGKCISLFDCKPLMDIINKTDRTSQDIVFLRNSQCGLLANNIPKVCCPRSDACVTPDGQPGKCIGLLKCTDVVEKLRGPYRDFYINNVKNLICEDPEDQSVCCVLSSSISATTTSSRTSIRTSTITQSTSTQSPIKHPCSSSMTANPPERNSGCCGLDVRTRNKIFGNVTWIDEYPWLVVIEYFDLNVVKLLCGGSLISGKYVVTAGHCVRGPVLKLGKPTNVRLGEYDTTSNDRDCIKMEARASDCTDPVHIIPIEKITSHPLYEPYSYQHRHDIALIRLRNTVPFTDFIRPICLPPIDYTINPPENFKLFAAGWGQYIQYYQDGKLRGIASDVKRDVELPYVDRNTCQGRQRTLAGAAFKEVKNGQMCAGGEAGKDACKGDSGGPLMYKNQETFEILGVVSYGSNECGLENMPGVYTNVHPYIPWILSQIEP